LPRQCDNLRLVRFQLGEQRVRRLGRRLERQIAAAQANPNAALGGFSIIVIALKDSGPIQSD